VIQLPQPAIYRGPAVTGCSMLWPSCCRLQYTVAQLLLAAVGRGRAAAVCYGSAAAACRML